MVDLKPRCRITALREMRRRWNWLRAALFVLQLLTSGCRVGPDYLGPGVPGLPDHFGSSESNEFRGDDSLGEWWHHFDDPVLYGLVETAVNQNLKLQEAYWRVGEARATAGIVKGNLFPRIGANGQDTYRKSSNNAREFVPINAASQAYDLVSLGIDSSWEIDLFGGLRRSLEAAHRDLEAYEYARRYVQVSLVADVAVNYVKVRVLQTRVRILKANLAVQEETLQLLRNRGDLASELDLREASARFLATRALEPALHRDLRITKNRVCVLLGVPPDDSIDGLLGESGLPSSDSQLGVGVPAELLCRRPDLWEAERRLAAASARIGIAKAEFYPKVTLTGNVGVDTRDIASLFTSQSISHSLGPSLRWNLFSFGRVMQNVKVQEARYTQARMQLLQKILEAVEQVDNGLVTYHESLRELNDHQAAAQDFAKVVEIIRLRNESVPNAAGGANGVDTIYRLLQAQLNLLQAQDRAAAAQGSALIGIVETYRALGGGWDNRSLSTSSQMIPEIQNASIDEPAKRRRK